MGYFSELDIDIKYGKEYIKLMSDVAEDRELSPKDVEEVQNGIWEFFGCPAPLTQEEKNAVLTDNTNSPYWEKAVKKLTTTSEISPVVYTKRNNR